MVFKSLDYSIVMPWGKNTLHSQTGIHSKMTAKLSFLYWKDSLLWEQSGKFLSPNSKHLIDSLRLPVQPRHLQRHVHSFVSPELQWTEAHIEDIQHLPSPIKKGILGVLFQPWLYKLRQSNPTWYSSIKLW